MLTLRLILLLLAASPGLFDNHLNSNSAASNSCSFEVFTSNAKANSIPLNFETDEEEDDADDLLCDGSHEAEMYSIARQVPELVHSNYFRTCSLIAVPNQALCLRI